MESNKPQLECWSYKDLSEKPLVLVTWRDITSTHTGWFETTSDLTTATIKSPGWILEETDRELKLISALGWHKEEMILGFDTVLPKGCIDNIETLKTDWWK